MSDLRVALVAEGLTDMIVIEAALKKLLPRPFVLVLLQPEPTRPKLGAGWGGVLRWCLDFALRGYSQLENDPTLSGFDLFVLHVDAGVAKNDYGDLGTEIAREAVTRSWPSLPNNVPCPPPTGGANVMHACLLSWASLQVAGPKTVLCIPSKATDAWLAAAVFRNGHALLQNIECKQNLQAQLAALPKAKRIKKTQQEYRVRAGIVTKKWHNVRQQCTQAERFSRDIELVIRRGSFASPVSP